MLSPDQQAAAVTFMTFLRDPVQKVMVLEGHSGTGKSFLTDYLLRVAQEQIAVLQTLVNTDLELNFAVTASTNKAARVIGKATNQEASTIHSYLNIKVVNDFRSGKQTLKKNNDFQVKENTLVIIDEASMIDSMLLNLIFESTHKCKILFIGDPYQLTPVFENSCPAFTKDFVTAKLTTIQRQRAGNSIIELGDKLRETVSTKKFFPLVADNKNIFRVDGPTFQTMAEDAFKNQAEPDTVKILAWSNDKVNAYNTHIRKLFTQSEEPIIGETFVSNAIVKTFQGDGRIAIGNDEKIVIQSYEEATYQNLEGWIVLTTSGARVFMPKYPGHLAGAIKQAQAYAKKASDWTSYFNLKENIADLRPIYASTVHKSQGSTYDTVFVDLNDIGRCNIAEDVARMLYVAITRASNKVVLYGELPKKYQGI